MLLVFESVSSLKINLFKSDIAGINLDFRNIRKNASLLGRYVLDWPLLYLGIPLGGNPSASSFWDLVVEKVTKCLDGGKGVYFFLLGGCIFSFEGHITLIHSCLSSIPLCFLSLGP